MVDCNRPSCGLRIVAGLLSRRSPLMRPIRLLSDAGQVGPEHRACRRPSRRARSYGLVSLSSPTAVVPIVAGLLSGRSPWCRRATAVVPIVAAVPAVESNGRGADVPALPIVAGLLSSRSLVPTCNRRRADRPRYRVQRPSCRSSPRSPLSSPTAVVPTCPPGADRRRAAVQPAAVISREITGPLSSRSRGADVQRPSTCYETDSRRRPLVSVPFSEFAANFIGCD